MSTKPLLVAQLLPRMEEGGAERGVVDLAREHGDAVRHVIISENGRLVSDALLAGARHLSLPMASKNPLTVPGRVRLLRKTLESIAPDIVHVRSRLPAWLHHFANRQLRLPTVSTVHGINSVSAYSRIMVRADAIICPSAAVATHIQRHYLVLAKKITVISRGVDVEYFDSTAVNAMVVEKLREEWGAAGRRVVLHVGRLAEQKGHDVLLRALALMPARAGWLAVFAGGGVLKRRRRLVALARRLGVADQVRFVGGRRDIREVYALADVVVSCARKPESFGRTMAEALAMNKSVIATAHGGALDIITNN
jgi:glycosyltransferase involved in cell wall biosynthesis